MIPIYFIVLFQFTVEILGCQSNDADLPTIINAIVSGNVSTQDTLFACGFEEFGGYYHTFTFSVPIFQLYEQLTNNSSANLSTYQFPYFFSRISYLDISLTLNPDSALPKEKYFVSNLSSEMANWTANGTVAFLISDCAQQFPVQIITGNTYPTYKYDSKDYNFTLTFPQINTEDTQILFSRFQLHLEYKDAFPCFERFLDTIDVPIYLTYGVHEISYIELVDNREFIPSNYPSFSTNDFQFSCHFEIDESVFFNITGRTLASFGYYNNSWKKFSKPFQKKILPPLAQKTSIWSCPSPLTISNSIFLLLKFHIRFMIYFDSLLPKRIQNCQIII
jgi:hypothetical protein